LDPDPKLGWKWDPDQDSKKIVTDPQHCRQHYLNNSMHTVYASLPLPRLLLFGSDSAVFVFFYTFSIAALYAAFITVPVPFCTVPVIPLKILRNIFFYQGAFQSTC
jgi:hypothetical protein